MEEIILHHYDVSPFSEKIRKILALKKLSWRGVEQPIIAPKPKLTPLTGGYRKIPVLQIGADVYCDTITPATGTDFGCCLNHTCSLIAWKNRNEGALLPLT